MRFIDDHIIDVDVFPLQNRVPSQKPLTPMSTPSRISADAVVVQRDHDRKLAAQLGWIGMRVELARSKAGSSATLQWSVRGW